MISLDLIDLKKAVLGGKWLYFWKLSKYCIDSSP